MVSVQAWQRARSNAGIGLLCCARCANTGIPYSRDVDRSICWRRVELGYKGDYQGGEANMCVYLTRHTSLLLTGRSQQTSEVAMGSLPHTANIWPISAPSSGFTSTSNTDSRQRDIQCLIYCGEWAFIQYSSFGQVSSRTRGVSPIRLFGAFTEIAGDTILDITTSVKYPGVLLLARHLEHSSTPAPSSSRPGTPTHFSANSRPGYCPIPCQHGCSFVMDGRFGRMLEGKRTGNVGGRNGRRNTNCRKWRAASW